MACAPSQGYVALKALHLRLGPQSPAWVLQHLTGRLGVQVRPDGFLVSTRGLAFVTDQGLVWPGGRVRVEHREARPRQGASTSVQADGIELEALAALAGRLPLPVEARDWLLRLAPRGRLENTALSWQARGSGPGAQRDVLVGELLEAARMDGASLWNEVVYVLAPMAVPGIASTVLLNVILAWNEAFWTLRLSTDDAAPLTAFIASFSSPQGQFLAKLSAASVLAILPILLLGWFSQKQLVRGLTFGAVK